MLAEDTTYADSNWGIQPASDNQQAKQDNNSDQQGADDFYSELIAPQYGSDQSPAFLHRENINPNESDYGYGSFDGYD